MLPEEPLMGKLVSVMKRVDVHGCIMCTLYVMYVDMASSQESVILYELPMGKLTSVTKHVDVRSV